MSSRNLSNNKLQYIQSNKYPAAANQVELTPIDSNTDHSKFMQVALYALVAITLLGAGFMGMKAMMSKSSTTHTRTVKSASITPTVTKSLATIGERVHREIDILIARQFTTGDWRFAGSELSKNEIVQVYIQIPQKLEMDKSHQQRYIQQMLCPAKNSGVWQLIEPSQIQFNLFTTIKRLSVSASCG